MRLISYGAILSLSLLFLQGCSLLRPEPQIQVVTNTVKTTVPIVSHPKPVQLNDIKIYVVSPGENLEEFKRISDLIVANRFEDNILDVKDKVYTRDVFGGDK